uniref:Uncharacterized protein n=1 Tax=Oryza rufipogon TaxID=4529 RepID=A0A0E0NT16_ORYRU
MTLARHRCRPSEVGLGFHPPSTACLSTVDTPILHRQLNLCRHVGITAPAPLPTSLRKPPPVTPCHLTQRRPLPPSTASQRQPRRPTTSTAPPRATATLPGHHHCRPQLPPLMSSATCRRHQPAADVLQPPTAVGHLLPPPGPWAPRCHRREIRPRRGGSGGRHRHPPEVPLAASVGRGVKPRRRCPCGGGEAEEEGGRGEEGAARAAAILNSEDII